MRILHAKSLITLSAFSMLLAGGLTLPAHSWAAPWLAPAASEELAADWVKEVETELRSDRFKDLFINAPGGSPHSAILRLLNQASIALNEGNKNYAQGLIEQAIHVVDKGVEKGWYTPADVEPVRTMIMTKATDALQGKMGGTDHISKDRWTGYTNQRPLGLTERLDDSTSADRFRDEAEYRK